MFVLSQKGIITHGISLQGVNLVLVVFILLQKYMCYFQQN